MVFALAVGKNAKVVGVGKRSDVYDLQKRQMAEIAKLSLAAAEHQKKCEADAAEFLSFYWGRGNKRGGIQLSEMRDWLNKNQPLDCWFFIHLIEAGAQQILELSYSRNMADIAKAKNKTPRTWVCDEWETRIDQGQSKAAFSRQYASLVKKQFNLIVTPDTIARDWLPKAKK